MPRFPDLSGPAGALPASIFARLMERLAGWRGDVYPFHLGDTHLAPPGPARLDALCWDEPPTALYRYASPAGDAALLAALAEKLCAKNQIPATEARLQVTAGATHAIACAVRALLDPHDEMLLLAPYWPLIRGHVLSVGARPVEVPFTSLLYDDPGADPAALLEPYITPRTAAIYLTTPNNPDGKVLEPRTLAAIAAVAAERGLWVIADEVYEHYAYDGRPHVSIASLAGMAERTVTAFSFSKSYAQAGLRVGYAVAPESVMPAIRKLANHTIYNVPRAMQKAALAALAGGEGFLAEARAEYAAARDAAVATLPLPCRVPEGGAYLFVDFARHVGAGGSALPVLERLAAEGILLAPGDAFGAAYASWARLCFTAVPRERLTAGLEKMAAILARG